MLVRQPPATSTPGSSALEVSIGGQLDADAVPEIRAVMRGVLVARPRLIVIDLAGCSSVDAAGVALLLEVHRCAWLFDGRVVLRSPGPQVRRVLRIVRVEHILRVERLPPRQTLEAIEPGPPQ